MKLIQIIKEYRRDVTGQALGDKMIQALVKETDPEGLHDIWTLASMVYRPQRYGQHRYAVHIGNELLTPDTKTAPEILQKHKQQVIDQLLQFIESRDPTAHREYTQWMVRQWIADNVLLEDLNRNNLIGKFDILKRKNLLKPEQRDINRFKTYDEFEDIISAYELPEDQKQEVNKGRSKTAYEDSDVRIVVPYDETASCYYGQGTKWCTAGRDYNQFNRYNNQGSLFILLPKHPEHRGEKYQLHFPSGQFMDERDEAVDISWLLETRFPNLLQWFFNEEPNQISTVLNFIPEENINDLIGSIAEDTFNYTKKKLDKMNIDESDKEKILNEVRYIGNISPKELIFHMAEYIDSSSVIKIPSFISDQFQMYTENGEIPLEFDPLVGNIIGFINGIKMVRDENGKWYAQPSRR
jgi:hypothetical protein